MKILYTKWFDIYILYSIIYFIRERECEKKIQEDIFYKLENWEFKEVIKQYIWKNIQKNKRKKLLKKCIISDILIKNGEINF